MYVCIYVIEIKTQKFVSRIYIVAEGAFLPFISSLFFPRLNKVFCPRFDHGSAQLRTDCRRYIQGLLAVAILLHKHNEVKCLMTEFTSRDRAQEAKQPARSTE
jgi:hypothetical protein